MRRLGAGGGRYPRPILGRWIAILTGVFVLAGAAPGLADDWMPHPSGGQWQYNWSDTKYNPNGTVENVTVQSQADPSGCGYQFAWTGTDNIQISPGSPLVFQWPDNGTMCFKDQTVGLVNSNWTGSAPPPDEPSLCPDGGNQCGNSLGSTLFNVIWGARAPVISEPLVSGTSWNATGGYNGGVTSSSQYLGRQVVKVPAFPNGVTAAAIRSNIALAGTPGDDYGSGIRTTWWVAGVGPAKVVFDHVDGSITTANLMSTNLKPTAPPSDQDYFPLRQGLKGTYQWTNRKYLPQPEIETLSVIAAVNRTGQIQAKSVSGPIRTIGQYDFSSRMDGVRNTSGAESAATLVKFPKLGHGRHFFTPIDLMTYGFNPLFPAYPDAGSEWRSGNARDFKVYGVTGTTTVIGLRTVRVPAGVFRALELRSTLTQRGYRFGSGVRTMWFAPGRGLVKLVFRHRDGSTSTVQLLH